MRRSITAAVLAVSLLSPAAALAEDAPPPTLTAAGEGKVLLVPDQATVDIAVRSGAFTASSARGKANARTSAIVSALERLGVTDAQLQTSGLTLRRTTAAPRKGHHQRRTFYVSSNSLTLTTPQVARLGAFIDAATRAGADDIHGPSFGFADPARGRIAAQAAALADARAQADAAAGSQGMRVVGVRSIDLTSHAEPRPQAEAALPSTSGAKGGAPTQVNPGREEFDATVTVVYEIAPA